MYRPCFSLSQRPAGRASFRAHEAGPVVRALPTMNAPPMDVAWKAAGAAFSLRDGIAELPTWCPPVDRPIRTPVPQANRVG
jgi:hypothetical protein